MNASTRALAGDDQSASHVISADLSESDPAKAISRRTVDLPPGEDDLVEGMPQHLQDSREVRRRMKRLAGKFNQQLAEQEARHQREIGGLREEVGRLAVSRGDAPATGDKAAHEQRMAALQAELEDATERGDSKKIAELTRKMTEESTAFLHAETVRMTGERTQTARPARTGNGADGAAAAPPAAGGGVTKEGQKWINAQEDWWDEDRYAPERAAAVAIHQQLLDEDSDPEGREHYVELERRVGRLFPKLPLNRIAARRQREAQEGEPSREFRRPDGYEGPIQPQPAGGLNPGRNRATLTPAQRATMITAHMDPNNDKHVLIYLREANALAAEEQ